MDIYGRFGSGKGKWWSLKNVGFLVLLTLPIVFYFLLSDHSDRDSGTGGRFPGAKLIYRGGQHLVVANSADLVPIAGKDFLLTFWVKIAGLPEPGHKIILLSKISYDQTFWPGYAFAIRHDKDGAIRPVVYWRSPEGLGRWYSFAQADFSAKNWVMFAVSYYDDRFLGLHLLSRNDQRKYAVKVLGGYEFDQAIQPISNADLKFGAVGQEVFHGKIGPLGVFSRKKISKDFETIFTQMNDYPLAPPDYFQGWETRLWTADGNIADGSGNYQLRFVTLQKKKQLKKEKRKKREKENK